MFKFSGTQKQTMAMFAHLRFGVSSGTVQASFSCSFGLALELSNWNQVREPWQALLRELLTADGVELAAVLVYALRQRVGWILV